MGVALDRPLVSVDEARRILAAAGASITRIERIPLAQAAGRVTASTLIATMDVPPFARAAMDGYALRSHDTHSSSPDNPVALRVVGRAYAGEPWEGRLETGTAIAIATGAPVPDGADAVEMIEDTRRQGEDVIVSGPVASGRHVTPRGYDVSAGHGVLEDGVMLTPARVGAAAAFGVTEIDVYVPPRVAILPTGDEVVAAGGTLGAGQIFDVNTTTLTALIAANGGEAVPYPNVGDDPVAIDRAFVSCLDADLVLVTGGSSVGERDHVLDTIARRGQILINGIAIKPGKPTILALVNGRPVFGLSGNPSSCLSNGYLFVGPLLRRLARLPPLRPERVAARLTRTVTSPAGRHQFFTVRIDGDRAIPTFKGSGEITSLSNADGYFEIAADCERVDEGTEVVVTLF
jgi:molybdenum cofactor synthesis domain-containing protein